MPIINRVFTDLDLSFIPNPVTGDIGTLVNADSINASVQNLILTNHYERLFHPEIGSNVPHLLFDNANNLTAIYLTKFIQDCLNNFEPRVTLQTVNVAPQPDVNTYSVTITYSINNVPTPITINFFLDLLR